MNITCPMDAPGRDIIGAMDHGLPAAETAEQVCLKPALWHLALTKLAY